MTTSTQAVEILLVEDNPDDVALTLHAFQKYHLSNRIKVVEDGAEALDFLSSASDNGVPDDELPRLILLDLKLPRIGGVEVLRRVKSERRTARIPVVVLTSSREDIDIEKCYELGVNSYIVKPVDFAKFSEAVRQMGLYWLLLNQVPRRLPAAQ